MSSTWSCQSGVKSSVAKVNVSNSLDLSQYEVVSLPEDLKEVSGQTFLANDRNILFMIQDEDGIIFSYDLRARQIVNKIHFGSPTDYEDITTDDSFFYILESQGNIHRALVSENDTMSTKIFKDLIPKGEYESLLYHKDHKQLYILCKNCKGDRKNNRTTGYILNLNGQGDLNFHGEFYIDLALAKELYSKFPKTFEPSGMSYDYAKEEWYILSSIDKMIMITDANFIPKEIIHFSRKHYEQPEGISLDGAGHLFISSEAGDLLEAKLFKIKMY